jgi:hypothetical protein
MGATGCRDLLALSRFVPPHHVLFDVVFFSLCVDHALYAEVSRTSLVAGPLIYIFADQRTVQYCISCLVLMYLMVSSSSLICYEKYKHRFADPNGGGGVDNPSVKGGVRASRVGGAGLRRQLTNTSTMGGGAMSLRRQHTGLGHAGTGSPMQYGMSSPSLIGASGRRTSKGGGGGSPLLHRGAPSPHGSDSSQAAFAHFAPEQRAKLELLASEVPSIVGLEIFNCLCS